MDELFVDAARVIININKVSIGRLQRELKIGFNRATQIVDQLEKAGVIGPELGTSPRKVLMTNEQFDDYLKNNPITIKPYEITSGKVIHNNQPKKFVALVCERCGGTLLKNDSYWVCNSCGTSYIRD